MSIDSQMEKIRTALFNEMDRSKDIIFSGLLENIQVNNIPESIFVNYFLPCFVGNNPTNSNWVMEWISIAGTPMAEVGVIKDMTNEVLFKVPPLLATNNLFLKKEGGDLGDIFSRYEQINNNLPSSGLRFLISALDSKNAELLNNLNLDSVKIAWYNILVRYGYITQQVGLDNQTQDSNLNDFLEF